ncbi:hypothetical protein [Streptomyces sp. NRRL S-350]|uniref:hypothetical protein n=1 Tax=Streptomyces sp. NRRL S-350 TaxID=1463902 RepID=UPI0004BECE1F|nr:hypothetical protein [Streptomyces sp. NRRL S-350]
MTTTTATGRDAQVEKIRKAIKRVNGLVAKGDEQGVTALGGKVDGQINALSGKGVRALQAELREEWAAARKAAKERAANPGKAVALVGKVSLATTRYQDVPGMVEKVEEIAQVLADGVTLELQTHELALRIARQDFRARIQITNKDGDPDWPGRLKPNKERSAEILRIAGEKFRASDDATADEAADMEKKAAAVQRLAVAIKNQRQNALVLEMAEIDANPTDEDRQIFAKAVAAYPDLPVGQAAQKFYSMPTELKKDALAASRKGELEGGSDGGDGDGDDEKRTPLEFIELNFAKAKAQLAAAEKRSAKLDDDGKAALKQMLAEFKSLMDGFESTL